MKSLTITDGGACYEVTLRDTSALPMLELPEESGCQQFLGWWREYAAQMRISTTKTAADIRVVKRLLTRYSVAELKSQAVSALLDYGDEFRNCEYESSLILLAAKLKQAGGSLLSDGAAT